MFCNCQTLVHTGRTIRQHGYLQTDKWLKVVDTHDIYIKTNMVSAFEEWILAMYRELYVTSNILKKGKIP